MANLDYPKFKVYENFFLSVATRFLPFFRGDLDQSSLKLNLIRWILLQFPPFLSFKFMSNYRF